jgi:predicted nucleic acid-binding protein
LAGYFLDSSVVAKIYHEEVGTPEVERLFLQPDTALFISRLTLVEVQSVFAGKVRTGVLSHADLQLLRRRFLSDIRDGHFQVVAILGAHFQEAETLIHLYGVSQSLRTLDALQLAVAIDLRRRGLAASLVTADKALCRVAGEVGLPTLNPETLGAS